MPTINLKYKNREEWIIPLIFFGLLLLTISKDLLHSIINDYRFYLSESMLFGIFWLLFVPFAVINKKLLNRSYQLTYLVFPFIFSILHLIIFALLVFSISGLFFYHTFSFASVIIESFADNILACILIYSSLFFIFLKVKRKNVEAQESLKKIKVTHQNKVVFLAVEDILYIKTERPYIALVTQHRTYLHNSTLKDIIDSNLPKNFVQIHKSTIVNINYISSYKSRKNGDYDVFMPSGDTLRVSRNFNTSFKLFSKVSA